jgi:hypothetical protein
MSKQVLKIISDDMASLGLEYDFGTYKKSPVVYPYLVGEYQETEPMTEDGLLESTFLLTGFNRGAWLALEEVIEKIEKYYGYGGKTVITDNGSGVAVFYAGTLIVPTGDAELTKIQINLRIKEWKVNN